MYNDNKRSHVISPKRKANKRKRIKTATKVLIVSVLNIVWFTVAAILLQFKTSVELSSTLITCWYTFCCSICTNVAIFTER